MNKVSGISINIHGYLMDFEVPKVMGILNITPDSFYAGSRTISEEEIRDRIREMIDEGVDIIDVGGCSTRPGYEPPSLEEEIDRVLTGCRLIREVSQEIPVSIDTFRAPVAEKAIEKWHADIINDISGGEDSNIWELAASLSIPYVLTDNPGFSLSEIKSREASKKKERNLDVVADVITRLSWKVNELHSIGVNDVIIDPGFGFSKTRDENFRLLAYLEEIAHMGLPVLAGISRKSMIYKTLGGSPEDSLPGTVALNAVALMKGADILRVHDVKEAKETIRLITQIKQATQ